MFIAALVTIAKTWRQPKSSSTDKWIRIDGTMGYYSAVKNENVICSNMHSTRDDHTKRSQKEEDKYHMT